MFCVLAHAGASILLLGRPGVGKTTAIREVRHTTQSRDELGMVRMLGLCVITSSLMPFGCDWLCRPMYRGCRCRECWQTSAPSGL